MDSISKKSEPKNSGENGFFYLEFEGSKIPINKVIYVSLVEGSLKLDKSDLVFSLIPNQDLITVIPKKAIRVNKKELKPNQMYILEQEDTLKFERSEFILKKEILKEQKEVSLPPIPKTDAKVEDKTVELKLKTPAVPIIENDIKKKESKKPVKKVAPPKKIPNIVKKEKESEKAMNSLVRVFALLVEVLICLILSEFIDFSFLIAKIKLEQIDLLVSSFKIDKSLLMNLYAGLLLFVLIRLSSPLVFGVSLGQALLGGFSPIGVLKKRVLGTLRELIGLFTFALIIFDLPSLIGKRTFKEVLSFSVVKGSGLAKTFLLILFVVTSLVSIYPIIPFFTYDMNFNSTDVQKNPFRQKEINKDELVNSGFFKLSFSKELAPLPFFRSKKINSNHYYYPEIKFLNSKSSISFVKEINYKKALKVATDKNPFLISHYPTIFKYLLNDSRKIKEKIAVNKLEKEILDFTKKSYALNLDSYIDHLFNHGPIVKGFLDYKLDFNNQVTNNFLSIEFFEMNKEKYLKLKQSQKTSQLLNYLNEKPKLIALRYDKFRTFIKSIRFSNNEDDSLISLIDKLNLNNEELLLEKAFEISFNYLKNAIDMENKDLIEKSFKSQIDYLNVISKKREDKLMIGKYVQNLSDALRSFIENDRSYFGLDLVTDSEKVNE